MCLVALEDTRFCTRVSTFDASHITHQARHGVDGERRVRSPGPVLYTPMDHIISLDIVEAATTSAEYWNRSHNPVDG